MSMVAVAIGGAPKQGARGTIGSWRSLCLPARPVAARRAWTRFAPIVLRIMRRTPVSDPTTRTFLQEVFIRVFRRIHDLKD